MAARNALSSIFSQDSVCPRGSDPAVKIEFIPHSVDSKEAAEYWRITCGVQAPPPESWCPERPREGKIDHSNRCTKESLRVLREFCRVPDEVIFRRAKKGESAADPPHGYFTVFEDFFLRGRLWFPIPGVIIEFLSRYNLTISQLTPGGIQLLVGILVLSYERGMDLSADYLDAWIQFRKKDDFTYYLSAKAGMSIVRKTVSNFHAWEKYFFFVRIDRASVAEECLPFFRSEWNKKEHYPLPPLPTDAFTVRDILRGGPFFWGYFSPERVRRAVLYHHHREHPEEVPAEASDPVMADYTPYDFPVVRERERSPRNDRDAPESERPNGAAVEEPAANSIPGLFEGEGSGVNLNDLPDVDFQALFDSLPDSTPPYSVRGAKTELIAEASRTLMGSLLTIDKALESSLAEAGKAKFQLGLAEKEIARLRDEMAARDARDLSRAKEEAAKVRRAERRGKRAMAAAMANRATQFAGDFQELQNAHKLHGNFRECRGSVGALWRTQARDYVYEEESAKMSASLRLLEGAKDVVSSAEKKIWESWTPIPVSPDSEEVGEGVPGDESEVNTSQFGASASGFFVYDP